MLVNRPSSHCIHDDCIADVQSNMSNTQPTRCSGNNLLSVVSMPVAKRQRKNHKDNTSRLPAVDNVLRVPLVVPLVRGLMDLKQNGGLQHFIDALTIYRQKEQVSNQSTEHLISADSITHCANAPGIISSKLLTSLDTVATSSSPPSDGHFGQFIPNRRPFAGFSNQNIVEPASFLNAIPVTSRTCNGVNGQSSRRRCKAAAKNAKPFNG